MHLDRDHDHAHDHAHDQGHDHAHAPRGHNRAERPAQWQTPHRPHEPQTGAKTPEEPDLDLVAASFAEGFSHCTDPTSFLRLAGVPFVGKDETGRRLNLLRVELNDVTDIGTVVPLLGGEGMRYAPLPARLASRRRQVRFVYCDSNGHDGSGHDGAGLTILDFAAARALAPETP